MSSGRDASSSARRMLAIRLVFCTLSRRPSPVAKKPSRALSLNDRITPQCKPTPYNCQELPYDSPSVTYPGVDLEAPQLARSTCAIKRRVLAIPSSVKSVKSTAFGVDGVFRSGAPEEIRTPDPRFVD